MNEKILNNRKNGMPVLLLVILGYVLAVVGLIFAVNFGWYIGFLAVPVIVLCMAWLLLGWILLCGLKVLKPQEAMVLTLFGQYKGTLKGEGFYFVNPFCTAVNPAASTVLNQSGDVKAAAAEATGMKMSLKIMTLSNNKQKINDCLGNPVEIGIAVMWRVVDTAKAEGIKIVALSGVLTLALDSMKDTVEAQRLVMEHHQRARLIFPGKGRQQQLHRGGGDRDHRRLFVVPQVSAGQLDGVGAAGKAVVLIGNGVDLPVHVQLTAVQ